MFAIISPSSWTMRSLKEPPCALSWFWCSPAVPPTSFWLLNTPTVMMPSVDQFFEVGMLWITSSDTTCRRITFWVSTTGLSPVTVIVSSRLPTRSSALTLAVKAADSSMPSRRTGVNPTRVKITV